MREEGRKLLQKLYYDMWFSYIHNFIIILSWVCSEPIQWPAPSWLVSLIGRALHLYCRAQEFESGTNSGFLFATVKSCVYNCNDLPSYNSLLLSSHIWFSYIHNFQNSIVITIPPLIESTNLTICVMPSGHISSNQNLQFLCGNITAYKPHLVFHVPSWQKWEKQNHFRWLKNVTILPLSSTYSKSPNGTNKGFK